MTFKKNKYLCLLLSLMLAGVSIFVVSKKQNYAVDEISSFELANYPGEDFHLQEDQLYHPAQGDGFKSRVTYQPPTLPWIDIMSVHEGHRFDYRNVWQNQALDVHPPLYYALLHTICSFFPGKHSMWYGEAINIIFVLLALWMFMSLAFRLTGNSMFTLAVAVFFVVNPGILNSTALMRMYTMAMFFILWITNLLIKYHQSADQPQIRTLITIAIATVLGALTHYYVILFTIVVTATICVIDICHQRYKALISLLTTMIISGVCALAVFPTMLDHALGSGVHGQNARASFFSLENFPHRMRLYTTWIDSSVFGFTAIAICVVFIAIVAILLLKKKPLGSLLFENSSWEPWVILLVPTLVYFVLVGKTSSYIADRYMYPIYPFIILCVLYLLFILCRLIHNNKAQHVTYILLLLGMTTSAYTQSTWGALCIIPQEQFSQFEEHKESDAKFIYKGGWNVYPTLNQVKPLNSLTLYTMDEMDELRSALDTIDCPFILFVDELTDTNCVKSQLPDIKFQPICRYGLAHSYIAQKR